MTRKTITTIEFMNIATCWNMTTCLTWWITNYKSFCRNCNNYNCN